MFEKCHSHVCVIFLVVASFLTGLLACHVTHCCCHVEACSCEPDCCHDHCCPK